MKLEPGIYRIRHKRKGEFVANLIGVEATKPGDPDDAFLRVQINTAQVLDEHGEFVDGPYSWMANAKVRIDGRKTTPPVTEKLLRPSLILGMERI